MQLEVNVKSSINKPIKEVFDAIIDQDKMNKYFASKTIGSFKKGSKLEWVFEDYNVSAFVEVIEIIPNERIRFNWKGTEAATEVEILFSKNQEASTMIQIIEKKFEMTAEGIKKMAGQTQGWTDFVCSLKAYLYTGINLRTGKMN